MLVLDTFHHRGETIRLVNDGLSDPVKAASDELIAAVSILLTIEVGLLVPWVFVFVSDMLVRLRRETRTISKSIWQG